MKIIKVKKGQILQRKDDVETKVYLVKSGLLRSYSIDNHGKEHIFLFAPEGWMIGDSVERNIPCDLFIDVLEDSQIVVLEKKPGENHHDKLLKRMAVLQKRIIMLMSSSAIERYDHFVETYPQIVQRVPQKMIASYLGITPEALSRAKKIEHNQK